MKLLLMSHGNMATEALKSAEMIMGPIKDTAAVGLQPNQGPEDLQQLQKNLFRTIPITNQSLSLWIYWVAPLLMLWFA